MKNVKQDRGMPPSSGKVENARTNAHSAGATVQKCGPFDYSEAENEDKDRIRRLKHGHDDCNYSEYNGSL